MKNIIILIILTFTSFASLSQELVNVKIKRSIEYGQSYLDLEIILIQNEDLSFTLHKNELKPGGKVDTTSLKLDTYNDFLMLYDKGFIDNKSIDKITRKLTDKTILGHKPTVEQIDLKLRLASNLLIKSQNQMIISSVIAGVGGGVFPILYNFLNPQISIGFLSVVGGASLTYGISSIVNKRKAYNKLKL
jgi:hypothetical protein